jgi:valyl-tRNA synthetase
MVIFGLFNRDEVPFRDVFIHPVIQDGKGQRMSKSAGNGIDPVDIIDLYGADALRYTLAESTTETQDLRMPVEKAKLPDGREVNTSERFEQGRTFPNKFWNAARLVLMNLEGYTPAPLDAASLPVEDRWILSRLREVERATTAQLEAFHFSEAARGLRDFTWNEFCDWYLEFVKGRLRDPETRPTAQRVVSTVLDGLCRLLHPIMPFVSEQVWQALGEVAPERGIPKPAAAAESVCVAPWPSYPDAWDDAEATSIVVESWQAPIRSLRNLRAEHNVPKDAKIHPILIAASEAIAARIRLGEPFLRSITPAESVTIATEGDEPPGSVVAIGPDVRIILPLEGLIDRKAEAARHRKTIADIDRQLDAIRSKLRNESFVSRAPAAVVDQQRARETELGAQREELERLLANLERTP